MYFFDMLQKRISPRQPWAPFMAPGMDLESAGP